MAVTSNNQFTAFSRQVANRNFLSPVGFKFNLSKTPKVDFFSQSVSIPNISLGVAVQTTYLKDIPVPGDKMDYGDLDIEFFIDENLENYLQIEKWMRSLGFPESIGESIPLDPNEDTDTDFDGIGNTTDTDDDDYGVIDELDTFPTDGSEVNDIDDDGVGNNEDIDDDKDGVTDFTELQFLAIMQPVDISILSSTSISQTPSVTQNLNISRNDRSLSNPFRGVGKWKIRKQVSGGADAHLFTVKYGEPGAKQNYEDFSQRSVSFRTEEEESEDEEEGILAFIDPPDPENPQDHNQDGIYEVVIGYVNTELGDTNVPIPDIPMSLSLSLIHISEPTRPY